MFLGYFAYGFSHVVFAWSFACLHAVVCVGVRRCPLVYVMVVVCVVVLFIDLLLCVPVVMVMSSVDRFLFELVAYPCVCVLELGVPAVVVLV